MRDELLIEHLDNFQKMIDERTQKADKEEPLQENQKEEQYFSDDFNIFLMTGFLEDSFENAYGLYDLCVSKIIGNDIYEEEDNFIISDRSKCWMGSNNALFFEVLLPKNSKFSLRSKQGLYIFNLRKSDDREIPIMRITKTGYKHCRDEESIDDRWAIYKNGETEVHFPVTYFRTESKKGLIEFSIDYMRYI